MLILFPSVTWKAFFITFIVNTVIVPIIVGSTDLSVSPNRPVLPEAVRAAETLPLINPSAPPDTVESLFS